MVKIIKNISLILIATILLITIGVFGFIYRVVFSLRNWTDINDYLIRIAIGMDQFGNIICGGIFDLFLIKNGTAFGSEDDTISEVLAKETGNLTWLGRLIASLLERIDKGHLKKSLLE